MALVAGMAVSGCSGDEVLRSVYETGRNACKQADNCTAEDD